MQTTQPPYEIEDGWSHPKELAEQLTEGDEIEFRYVESDGSVDEERPYDDEPVHQKTVTVKKIVSTGAVFVTVGSGVTEMSWKLHSVPGGTVTGTNPYGNRSVRQGVNARVKQKR